MCYSVTGACGVWAGLDMGLVLGVEVVVECRMMMMMMMRRRRKFFWVSVWSGSAGGLRCGRLLFWHPWYCVRALV